MSSFEFCLFYLQVSTFYIGICIVCMYCLTYYRLNVSANSVWISLREGVKKRAFIDYKYMYSEVMNDYHLNKNFCPSLFQKFCQVSEASLYIRYRNKQILKKVFFGTNLLRKWFFLCFYFECPMLKKFKKIWYSYCLFLGAIAMVIPHLDLLIALIGALASSSLALIFPPIIELLTLSAEGNRPSVLIIVKDVAIMLLGLLGCITGTYAAILGIVNVSWPAKLHVSTIVTRHSFCVPIPRIWCHCKFSCLLYCTCWKHVHIYTLYPKIFTSICIYG